jgi:hypothetical protein
MEEIEDKILNSVRRRTTIIEEYPDESIKSSSSKSGGFDVSLVIVVGIVMLFSFVILSPRKSINIQHSGHGSIHFEEKN